MNIAEEIPDYVPPGEPKKWFHSAWTSRGFLLVAGLFFLLPFININCGGKKLATVKGTDLIFGKDLSKEIEAPSADEEDSTTAENGTYKWPDSFGSKPSIFESGDQKNITPNILGIAAFSSLILGLIFTFFGTRIPVIIAGGFSLLAALCLFFIQVQVHNEMETKLGPFNFMSFTFDFTPYYWLCILFMAFAGVFSFLRSSILVKK